MATPTPHGRHPVLRRLLLVLSAVLLMLAGVGGPARAHTDLVGSSPGPGDTVRMDADRLVLVFADTLAEGASQVVVLDDHAADAVSGPAVVSGSTVELPLDLQRAGRHEVTYRVVSGDGHAIVGEFEFDVRPGDESAASAQTATAASEFVARPGPPETSSAVPLAAWAVGLALVVGGLVVLRRGAQGRPKEAGPR